MNRTQEYEALLQELQELPSQLDGTARRAKARRRGRRWGGPLASLAGVCAAFVLAVNWMPPFARACSGIPFLRELAAAVTFSPSLSDAVAHDYAQPVGQSQTVDGVTMTVEYVVADAQQMVVFYQTSGETVWEVECDLEDEAGNPLDGYAVTSFTAAGDSSGGLRRFTLHFTDMVVPDTLVLKLRLRAEEGEWSREPYIFPIHLDPEKTAKARILSVEQWVELDGQRLKVDRLELTPTRTALCLEADPNNSAWLAHLSFHFTGADGTVYENSDSEIGGMGQKEGVYTYYFQSLYFAESELTLWIDGAVWLEKDVPGIVLNLSTGQYTGELPADVLGLAVEEETTPDGGRQQVIWAESAVRQSPFVMAYRDEAGEEHTFSGLSILTNCPEGENTTAAVRFRYSLEDGVGDTLELTPAYSWISAPDTPISLLLGQ